MKKITQNKWTDGEHIYEGNPKDGFTKIGDEKRAKEIVEAIRERTVDSGEIVAEPVKMDKKTVDTEDKE